VTGISEWAREQAAKLPPLGEDDIQAVGALAARIDARIRAQQAAPDPVAYDAPPRCAHEWEEKFGPWPGTDA
jgi:hypothetical protein